VAVSQLLPESLVSQGLAEVSVAADSGKVGFPSPRAAGCNELALHPRLKDAATQLLGCADLRLLDSVAMVMASSGSEARELPVARMSDTHSLLAPSRAGAEVVYAVVFLDESAAVTILDKGDLEEGQWAVSDTITGGVEVIYRGQPGVVLFVRAELYQCILSGATQRVGFRQSHASWVQGDGAGFGLAVSGMPRDWMASLSVDQRTLLGFPPPGSPYWTDDTIRAVSHHCAFGSESTTTLLCLTHLGLSGWFCA
jgi:hypothetical protein